MRAIQGSAYLQSGRLLLISAPRDFVLIKHGSFEMVSPSGIALLIWNGVAMLILTRRVGESIMIGEEVVVTVLGVKGNQVRIGVNAPKEVSVHREEIYERIKREDDGSGPQSAAS